MNFKICLILALMCAYSSSKSIPTEGKIPQLNEIIGELKNGHIEWDWNEFLIDYILHYLSIGLAFVRLDNIQFPNRTIVPEGPLSTDRYVYYDTHLRGIQKFLRYGRVTYEIVEEPIYTVLYNTTANVRLIDFRTKYTQKEVESAPITRFYGTGTDMKVNMIISIATNPFFISIPKIVIASPPEITIREESPDSAHFSQGRTTLQDEIIPEMLNGVFSEENVKLINKHLNEVIFPKWVPKQEIKDTNRMDAFLWVYGQRVGMPDVYSMPPHNFTISNTGEKDSQLIINLSRGNMHGLDFLRRVQCPNLQCNSRLCPAGEFVLKYDEVYISYDIRATSEGNEYRGSVYYTITGLQEKELYECEGVDENVVVKKRIFINPGEMIVDLKGLPVFPSLKEELLNYGIQIRDALLEELSNV